MRIFGVAYNLCNGLFEVLSYFLEYALRALKDLFIFKSYYFYL